MVTKGNKEQFEKWVTNQYFWDEEFLFSDYPFVMQIGVYLAYYDSLGLMIYVEYHPHKKDFTHVILDKEKNGTHLHYNVYFNGVCDDEKFNTRNEAYKEAFKKADKLINDKL